MNPQDKQRDELFKALDKISEYNKMGGRGHGDLDDTCYICGISPSNLKAIITQQQHLLLDRVLEEVIGGDEVFEKRQDKKYLSRTERTQVTRNVLRDEQRQAIQTIKEGL